MDGKDKKYPFPLFTLHFFIQVVASCWTPLNSQPSPFIIRPSPSTPHPSTINTHLLTLVPQLSTLIPHPIFLPLAHSSSHIFHPSSHVPYPSSLTCNPLPLNSQSLCFTLTSPSPIPYPALTVRVPKRTHFLRTKIDNVTILQNLATTWQVKTCCLWQSHCCPALYWVA